MGNSKNIIDINGKQYDAVSGSYLGATASSKLSVKATSPGMSIDGFMRTSRGNAASALKPMPNKSARQFQPKYVAGPLQLEKLKSVVSKSSKSASLDVNQRLSHNPSVSISPHAPQKATTLMRSAVKKPKIIAESVIKARMRTDILTKIPLQTVVAKMSYNQMNPVRTRHAARMIQSPSVSRYHTSPVTAITAPTETNKLSGTVAKPTPRANSTTRPLKSSVTYADQFRVDSPSYSNYNKNSNNGLLQSNVKPNRLPHKPYQPDIFEQALADAKSHEQTYTQIIAPPKKRGLWLRLVGGSLVALLMVGALAYHSSPDLSLRLASYKSGLHAKMPSAEPSGFSFGYLSYEPGNVVVNYLSPSDSRQFNIKQKASSWDSQALLSNFVSSANSAYKTYQRAGRTVYLMNNNTATWVDSGVWYTVDGNSSLSSTQLLDVATSM